MLLIPSVLFLSAVLAFGQYLEASVQLPATPVPGQVFTIRVRMSGAAALQVEAVEPLYEGPARYLGADVRPFVQVDGPASSVDYHFLALEEGSLVISSLSVLFDGSPIQLGSWHIAVGVAVGGAVDGAVDGAGGSGTQAGRGIRSASWMVPEAVRVYEAFLAKAVLVDGSPVVIRSLAVPGAVTRPSNGNQGWTVIGTREGELNLPALDLDTPAGKVRVAARSVKVQPLPRAAAATRAVGSWSVTLKVELAGGVARQGDSASWEAVAHGDGSAGFAEPPAVRVLDPRGQTVPLLAQPFRFGQAIPGVSSFSGYVGAIGTFILELPGEYRVELEPYSWFDPASSQLRYARAAPVTIQVLQPETATWLPPADLKFLATTLIHRLAESGDGFWAQALVAIERGNVDEISLLYEQAAAARPEVGSRRLPWRWPGPESFDQGMAALAFMGNDPVRAFHEAARLERWSFLPGNARAFADAIAKALEISDRPRARIPPPIAIGLLLTLLILLACILLFGPFRHVSLLRLAGFMVVGLALLFLVALALSIVERGEVYFVSNGGSAMAVPSVAASVSFEVRPGSIGTVLRRIPQWVFVEFNDGRNAWLPESEICLY